ncbi:site-specific DNA-methyltransferase [Peribacillus butanolivorans]|uniref:site-specific DNA-methyltransferase n=1 Tax=Peribacillus butanolivorans TaxID=421767 RepID=UPI0036270C80
MRSYDQDVNVEQYEFEPIKGYPMLNWKGKRPFRSTQFYPAQLKETHREAVDGWVNKIFWGDNLQVMSHLLKDYRGKVKMIYIDPPFDSKADYKKTIALRGKSIKNDLNFFTEKQYSDIWHNDEYLQFMYERLILMRELLSEDGSIFLHCDWHKVHHLRCLMDEVFGPERFINEVIWCYHGPGSPGMRQFNRKHDNILWYSKGNQWTFNADHIRIPHHDKTSGNFKSGLTGSGFLADEYNIPEGKIPEDYWNMAVAARYPKDGLKRVGYPTEKPANLIERIIMAASNKGDIVFDGFLGSGVTAMVSIELGRKFIGTDINLDAVHTTTNRLMRLNDKVKTNGILDIYSGFSIYNVNNYEIFRNPVQAKELLIEALEIQPIQNNALYDGEKDGRMVKIMSVNRIATRADLNELITNFDYKLFEKRQMESPSQPVEKLLLVCMGHEPDLAAVLEQEVGYKLDIEVVDILRDKSNLEFKRDSEAVVNADGGKLIIRNFYPMNLLQKLSIMKENVDDWKELVESVMIDWNYDGAVLEPTVVDIPEKNELVTGIYEIPEDAGTIRVKITDLLSESIEVSIDNA